MAIATAPVAARLSRVASSMSERGSANPAGEATYPPRIPIGAGWTGLWWASTLRARMASSVVTASRARSSRPAVLSWKMRPMPKSDTVHEKTPRRATARRRFRRDSFIGGNAAVTKGVLAPRPCRMAGVFAEVPLGIQTTVSFSDN